MLLVPSEAATFVAASIMLAFVPGPDLLFVLTEGMLRGRRAGIAGMLGLCSGLVFHITAIALGVAALVQASPMAFAMLRYLGAAYLLYLAWKAWGAGTSSAAKPVDVPVGLAAIYRRGVVMNVTNPKVAIFFLAFLPQFAHPERGAVALQMLMLGGIFMLCSGLCFLVVAVVSHPVGTWLRRSPVREAKLNMTASLIFVALAVKLAVG